MGDVKTLLKEARKLIDGKNFKEAQECCKNILRKDKQNYIALVLLGKALQDSDQAPLAYQKAIASKPESPLAWQGLAHYYESKEDDSSKSKLLPIYKEMLKLQIEEDKILEIIAKLGQLGCTLKDEECLTSLICVISSNKYEKICEAAKHQLIEVLKASVPCKGNDIELVINILKEMYQNNPTDALQVLIGKVIIQKSDFASAVEEIIHLEYFSSNVLLREWLCSYLCKEFVRNMSFGSLDIDKYVDKVIHGIENSKHPALLKSMIAYDKGFFLEAYKQCAPIINYQQADTTEATLIIKCTIMLKKWSVTQKLATNFLTKAKDVHFVVKLKKFLFLAHVKQLKWKQAFAIAKEIPRDMLNAVERAALAECYIENNEGPEELLESLNETEYYPLLQSLALLNQQKYKDVIEVLENINDSPMKYYYLGRALWELEEYDQSLVNFLKAAKLDPDHAFTFFYLGNYYFIKNHFEKARKCYEKAYNLNCFDPKIAKILSETYTYLKLTNIDFEFLVSAEKSLQTNQSWLYFRLGLHYLNRREWENAIINFRIVIKTDHNNSTAFECLADAYYSRGSYTSALRAYNKVIVMDPKRSSHCLTRIGYIYSLLTQYEDAITTFKKVLDIESSSVLALKGIAETWIRIAKKKVTAKLYGTARDSAQHAIDYIMKALSIQKHFTCFWKLFGDTLMFITKLPNIFAYVHIKESMQNLSENDEMKRKEKLEIFPHAISCYSHIAKQRQQFASYDLASAYLNFYHETKKENNCHISFNLSIACVKDKPTVWRNWNLLGKICLFIKRFDIAQHCFIKALMVTRKWSVAKIWCNLGTLYLKLKLHKLSNYCFWRGQSTLPSYPQSWIGQGLIAEGIREEEAMDLFRHASRLGYHPESALGYADWVCRTLKDIKYVENPEHKYVIDGLFAINYAVDLIEWFSNFEPNNACACNILGILQERSGLLKAALTSYEKALQYAEEDKKNIILLNVGRILLRMEKYEEAIKVYKAITEASLNSTCGLALALFKKGLYEESYSVYDTALHWLSNDNHEKADLLVAMAGIIYMFKGVDDAKTILFHSIQISQKKPTAYSLFGICSLGLIHSELSLTKLALSELQKYEMDNNFGFDIGFLKSYVFICEGNVDQAIKLLSDSLHDHPNNALLWFCMAEYSLKTDTRAKVASRFAQRAISSSNYKTCTLNAAKMIATASIAEHIAGDKERAFTLAKKGLHMYPHSAEIWAALMLSLLSHKLWMERKEWMLSGASYMRRHLNISRQLSRWVSLLEKKIYK